MILTYTNRDEKPPKTHVIKSMSRVTATTVCGVMLLGIRQFEDKVVTVTELRRIPRNMICKKCVMEALH